MEPIRIGILNVSDRASAGIYEDIPGQEARRLLGLYLASPWECAYAVVPDEQEQISRLLLDFIDRQGCCLVLTTGGTGPSPRDVTPEATMAVCTKLLPGFGEAMRAQSLLKVPTAILSRQVAGIRGRALIINLPGKPRAIGECLAAVFPAVPYCIDLLGGPRLECRPEFMVAFRPPAT